MAPSSGIVVGENVAIPSGNREWLLRNAEPGHGVAQPLAGHEVVDDQILLAVIIDIGSKDAVDTGHVGIDQPEPASRRSL